MEIPGGRPARLRRGGQDPPQPIAEGAATAMPAGGRAAGGWRGTRAPPRRRGPRPRCVTGGGRLARALAAAGAPGPPLAWPLAAGRPL